MHRLLAPAVLAALLLPPAADAASLNKCVGAAGEVTYSNLPCRGARHVQTVPIDPAPEQPAGIRATPIAAATPALDRDFGRKDAAGASVRRVTTGEKRRCDAIAEKLGRVLDTMDQARRKGYTLEQADKWGREIKDLQRKKQQAGCF
ncbi:MAG: DUF4124 domain-containing protein [Thiobacillus sp.]